MINEFKGDLLEQNGILCHQTNYHGVMGAGIAAAIRSKLLSKEQYEEYQNFCRICGDSTLGFVQWFFLSETKIVANCFCQNGFENTDSDGSVTNYSAMMTCFEKVRDLAEKYDMPVFIPGGMGCGIAGGNWERVHGIIESVFGGSKVSVTIVWLEV